MMGDPAVVLISWNQLRRAESPHTCQTKLRCLTHIAHAFDPTRSSCSGVVSNDDGDGVLGKDGGADASPESPVLGHPQRGEVDASTPPRFFTTPPRRLRHLCPCGAGREEKIRKVQIVAEILLRQSSYKSVA